MTTSSREDGLRQDVEPTREQLRDTRTLEALVHKANVPGGVKDKVHDAKETGQPQG